MVAVLLFGIVITKCGIKYKAMLERKFWSPSLTTQFRICPIPFHFDTYRGCTYGCIYCFARDLIEFQRRNAESEPKRRQSYLVGNSPKGLRKWIEKATKNDYDFSKGAMVAFKERIPVKIGATADPFPIIEKNERITYECLKIFQEYDYPVQISTKNPEVFLSYAKDFIGANIAINVSMSFYDDDMSQQIEVGAITPSRRFEAIKSLSELGFKITVRLQPFILPYSEIVAEKFVAKLKDCGAWAFQTEGLKLRVSMSQKEKDIYSKIGKILGFDIISYFKENGDIEGGDRVYNEKDKRRMLDLYNSLSKKYGIRFYNADNLIDKKYGCGSQCCGTEVLRDYKIWGGCLRSKVFGDSGCVSSLLGKCLVNFTRKATSTKNYVPKTIYETTLEYINAENKKAIALKEKNKHRQLSLFEEEYGL